MRRFNFFDRETVRSPWLQCLDITAGAAGRGVLAVGDSEGAVVLLDRDARPLTAFRAHALRVSAMAILRSADFLVTVGDGADARPPHVRAAARGAVLAARDRLRRERDRAAGEGESGDGGDDERGGRRRGGGGGGRKYSSQDDDSEGSGSDDGGAGGGGGGGRTGGGGGGGGGANARDLGALLGLGNLVLEGPASPLVRGDGLWEAGAALGSDGSGAAAAAAAAGRAPGAVLKVWRLDRRDPRTGSPECVRTVRLFGAGGSGGSGSGGGAGGGGAGERVVTSFAIAEDGSQAAIGCGDGAILLLRGDLLRGSAREGRLLSLALGGGGAGAVKTQWLQDAVPRSAETTELSLGLTSEAVTTLA
jgi:hypothetical protein